MIINNLSIFAIAATSWFVLGCNSHAVFESNNNCNNHRLDEGETCEKDAQGNDFFADAATCTTLGFSGGQLKCKDVCQLDTSDCRETDPCDPIFDTGCNSEDNCVFFPTEDSTGCAIPGTTAEGQPCTNPSDCDGRMTCLVNLCRRVCQPDTDCPDGQFCEETGWLDGTLGLCPLPNGICNPITGGGCQIPAHACYFSDNSGNIECLPQGEQDENSICGASCECRPGYYCAQSPYQPGESRCLPLCNDNHPCTNGGACAFSRGAQPGICLFDIGCNPLDTEACGFGRACYFFNDFGQSTCLLTGLGGTGSSCNMFLNCDSGFFCDNAGNNSNVCRLICDGTNLQCGGEDSCSTELYNFPFGYGVCK
ncbi:hypothetical protein KKD52_14695 [Myxococcota bacterium]|nr:hypothetical protein [Myxococcota bacterium]MBU1413692.1 hypothetical protein [Myxococcota bacterium]MBU1511599.1 hypothetical protein [Myxococcota bacterium]